MSFVAKARLIGAIIALFFVLPTANAQLYGLSSSTPGSLYALNGANGAATFITDLVNTQQTSLVGLAFLNGTLYASDVYDSTGTTFTFGALDPSTGVYTPINTQGGSNNWQALAANSAANVLYTVDNDITPGSPLLAVTPSGVITTIGNTGLTSTVGGLAYINSVLYAVAADADDLANPYRLDLYTLSTTTGAATLVGGLGIANTYFDLAYDSDNATLYLNTGAGGNGSDNQLYTVNTTTGVASAVGTNGVTAGSGIDGLAWRPVALVPEPGAWALCGALCFTLGALAKRRR